VADRSCTVTFVVTVKFDGLVPVPEDVVTAIGPVTAFAGTVAVIWVAESTVNVVAATPPNVTDVAPVKPEPAIVTTVPALPLVGVNVETQGPDPLVTMKSVVLVAVPSESVTAIFPVVAPDGTVAVICVFELTVKDDAAVPLKVTEETALGASWNPDPWMMTVVPTGPHVGENDEIVGGAAKAEGTPTIAIINPAESTTVSVLRPSARCLLIRIPPYLALSFERFGLRYTRSVRRVLAARTRLPRAATRRL
jgi:hypothetical protein